MASAVITLAWHGELGKSKRSVQVVHSSNLPAYYVLSCDFHFHCISATCRHMYLRQSPDNTHHRFSSISTTTHVTTQGHNQVLVPRSDRRSVIAQQEWPAADLANQSDSELDPSVI